MIIFVKFPDHFRVLENNIPINYWIDILNTRCNFVNIDIRPIREQILTNLKFVDDQYRSLFHNKDDVYIIAFKLYTAFAKASKL